MSLRQSNERGKQNSQWLRNLSEGVMRQENYQNFSDKNDINESNNNMVKQPIFESYLQIQQVQSKQIPINQLYRVEQNDEATQININKRQKTNNQCNYQPQQQEKYGFLAKILQVIKNMVIFQKPNRFISQNSPHQSIVTLTIGDIIESIEEYSQYQKKTNFQYCNTQNHMPLSHYQSKINPLESAFSINEQPSPVPRQSISLFSRMMKPNQLQMKKINHYKNCAQKNNATQDIFEDFLQSLQNIYSSLLQFMQIISSPSISEQKQLEQIKYFLSFSLKLKIIQSVQKRSKQIDQSPYLSKKQSLQDNEWSSKYITSRKIESKIHKKKFSLFIEEYDLNQIHISNQQSIFFKETVIVYLAILKEVLIKSQHLFCGNQIKMINNLPSYKSKQTNFCSFPSQGSKSMSSYPSLQIRSKNLTQSKMQSNKSLLLKDSQLEIIIVIQTLVRKISQNKNVLNRKKIVFNDTQSNQDQIFTKSSLVQFTNLLYDVWLSQAINRKKLGKDIQKVSNYVDTGFIFSSIYELLPSDQQTLLFLIFVLKQLEYNLLWNLSKQKSFKQQINQNQSQSQVKSSDRNSPIKQKFMKKSSLNQQIQEEQDRTKRIKSKSAKNNDIQQLQQTRNKYLEQISESMQSSNKHESTKKQNSSSKLALSRLYQSKLNNIIKKTQRINQQVAKTHSNSNKTTSQSKQQHFIQQQSLMNLKSKHVLMRSKNPIDHMQNLHILQLKQTLIQKNYEIQEKQKLIKKLMFMQEINQIDNTVSQKNIETIYTNKIQNIKNQYKQKLKSKQQEIKTTKQNLKQKHSYIQQVKKQRKIQAKLLQESNQIYNLKKWTLPEKEKQLIKAKYSQSLSHLKKGCYKDLYTQKNKQNIQQMSNITQKDQSISVLRVAQQKVIPSKSLIQPQINCKKNILNKLKNLHQKIDSKNKSVQPKFFSQF